jgi:hypothetical protein
MTRLTVGLLAIGTTAMLFGQDDVLPNATRQAGSLLQSVSISSGYYTGGTPAGFEVVSPNQLSGPTAMVAVTAAFGGSKSGEKSSITWSYSPSYFSTVYSESNVPTHGALNHRFGLTWQRKLGSRWSVNASANGFLASMEQLYFAPGLLSSVAAVPTTFDDLAAALLAGKYSDAQLAALLTGSSVHASPEQQFPYGTRLMSAAANLGLTWAPTGRTSLSVTLTGGRTQTVNGAGITGRQPATPVLTLPPVTNAAASISWGYSLSPRTNISIQATSSRTFSRIQQGYASSMSFSVGRTLSRRWFVQGSLGAGGLTYGYQRYAQPKTIQYLAAGSVGFKTSSYTLLASYSRSLGDAYGLGSGTSSTGAAGWSWNRPGSPWSLTASVTYQELNNPLFRNTRSWRTGAGLGRSLGQHLTANWQYIYMQLPADIVVAGLNNTENGVMASLTWRPGLR